MEVLKNLIVNVPDWVNRLEELSSQIEQRQVELAQLQDSLPARSGSRSIRNRGSTESLKAKDDQDGAHALGGNDSSLPTPLQTEPLSAQPVNGHKTERGEEQPPSSPASDPSAKTPSALKRQTSQVIQVAQARARATLRKRQRTESMVSNDNTPKFRTRSMVIVYYDSYVQSFFEELVKFVSASRNLMRKAKMAAKVAQIKRLAELEMPDEGDDLTPATNGAKLGILGAGGANGVLVADDGPLVAGDANGQQKEEDVPALVYTSTRQMRTISRRPGMAANGLSYPRAGGRRPGFGLGRSAQQPDVYDDLDRGLEYVQSTCEHAAHQFLRDGDCNEEIENIKRRLVETKEMSDKEMARVMKEDPEALNDPDKDAPPRPRSYRPTSMRREIGTNSAKEVELEVDDEGIDDMDAQPRLVYKSTRNMRGFASKAAPTP